MVKSLESKLTQELKSVTMQVDLCDRQRVETERRLNQALIDQSQSVEKALTIAQGLRQEMDTNVNTMVKPIAGEVKEFKEKVEAVIA